MNFLRWNRAIDRCSGKYAKDGYASLYVDKPKGYVHRRRYSYSSSEDERSTSGRIIPSSDKKGYASNSLNRCPCMCCPHSSPASSSASPSATTTSRQRRGSGRLGYSEDPKDDRPPESSRCGPSSSYHRHGGGRQESTIKEEEVPSERHRLISSRRGGATTASISGRRRDHRDSRAEHKGAWSIDVVDRTDKSRSKHHDGYGGRVFPLALSRGITATEIMNRLAPDARDKVVVHWKDGAQENFDEYVSSRDIREYASFLEVKRRKTVHWRYNPV